jgi:methylenetetrahydrofolate reductase (NADPH)
MNSRRLDSYYKPGVLGLSFEVYPPKNANSTQALFRVVEELCRWKPAFISVTYGAGGSTRSQSLELLSELKKRMTVPLTAHFTCVGSTTEEIESWLAGAQALGVENVMALRGDPPQGQEKFVSTVGGLGHANELVQLIQRKFARFGVGVAGYPEPHREAVSPEDDLKRLKTKVESGAHAVFTQLFYRNEDFFRFRERYEALGIAAPLVPGILPVLSLDQLKRITKLCGASIPPELLARLEACKGDGPAQIQVGIEYATEQCEGLIREGVPGIHFYVLNRSDIIDKILSRLGIRPT